MGRRNIRSCVIAGLLSVATAQFLQAGYKVESIRADQFPPLSRSGQPSEVSKPAATTVPVKSYDVSLQDATANEIVTKCAAMLSLSIVIDESLQKAQSGGPTIVYDLFIRADNIDEALDQMGRSLRMTVSKRGEGYRVGSYGPIGLDTSRRETAPRNIPADEGPTPNARVESVRVTRSLAKNQQAGNRTYLAISYWPGPAGVIGETTVSVKEAIDEQGRDIRLVGAVSLYTDATQLRFGRAAVPAVIQTPSPRSKQIKTLSAVVKAMVPTKYDRLTIDAFDDKPIACIFGGLQFKIGPLQSDPQGWRLPVIYNPMPVVPTTGNQRAFKPVEESAALMDIQDANGTKLRIVRDGTGSGSAQGWAYSYIITRGPEPRDPDFVNRATTVPAEQAGKDASKPVSMVWHVITQTALIEIPVTENNLRIP